MPARILIVEDDAASRALLMYLFTGSGYGAIAASDGAIGVRIALETGPDLILCDLQMPNLDGFGVLQKLIHTPHWRRVPIIAVTAFSMPGDRETAIAAGFNGYFSKPITPETFAAQIESFLPSALLAPRPVEAP
jgi:two-component system, cell cycle response regulator DivK